MFASPVQVSVTLLLVVLARRLVGLLVPGLVGVVGWWWLVGRHGGTVGWVGTVGLVGTVGTVGTVGLVGTVGWVGTVGAVVTGGLVQIADRRGAGRTRCGRAATPGN